jgi:uncharacterized phage protein (TIGR02216 family)
MRIGLGHLRMNPDDFWRMTLPEFFAACDGYMESRGVRKGGRVGPPTRAEVDALFAQIDDQGRLKPNV